MSPKKQKVYLQKTRQKIGYVAQQDCEITNDTDNQSEESDGMNKCWVNETLE
ncbi:15722_t:CDS:2 [Acaulospora morrowiae]|uniref:15722_t:CDS:1 n=1 Tax=Acaulospora morrowiae TaxID=94023 RepID=A0A9N8V7T0_9GLOM|nr:15722_t:CDS:2 [Acaulospora morrowiae]